MEKILLELLKEDRSLLLRNKELLDELEKRISPGARRKFSSLKMALENNVGVIFAKESDISVAKEEAKKLLAEIGMDSAKADSVIKIFENVLGELQEIYAAEAAPPPEPEPEPPKVEPPKVELSKPEPPKVEPQKFEPPKVEPPKPEPQKHQPLKIEPPKVEPPKTQPPKQTPPPTQEKSKVKNLVIGAVVLLALAGFLSSGSDQKQNTSSPPPQSSSSSQSGTVTTVQQPEAKTDLSLNGIDLGLDAGKMIEYWGEPLERERREDGNFTYHYGSIDVGVVDGKVHSFVTRDPKYKTLRGLHVSSTYDEVAGEYGTNSKNMALNELMLYEYPFTSLDGQYGLLRFAVNKANKVEYISVRIPDPEPAQNQQNRETKSDIDENTKQAAIAFIKYHEAITNKDFSTAFSIMAPAQRDRLGPTLRDFSSGYSTTISSEITQLDLVSTSSDFVVMNYVLDARDRRSNGILYQQFSGQVEMEKSGGEWKIYSTHSKKIKEVMER